MLVSDNREARVIITLPHLSVPGEHQLVQ